MLHFRPPENQWLEMTLFILFPPLHVGQGSDGTSVSAPFSIGSGWREGGLPHIWRSAVGRRPRQPGSWATAISMEPPQVVSQAWWLGPAGPLTHQLRDTKMYSRERDRGRSSVTLHGLAVAVRGCSLCPAVGPPRTQGNGTQVRPLAGGGPRARA